MVKCKMPQREREPVRARAPEGSQTLLMIQRHVRLFDMYFEGLQTPPVVFTCPKLYFTRLHAGALFRCQNREGATGCMKPFTTHMDC